MQPGSGPSGSVVDVVEVSTVSVVVVDDEVVVLGDPCSVDDEVDDEGDPSEVVVVDGAGVVDDEEVEDEEDDDVEEDVEEEVEDVEDEEVEVLLLDVVVGSQLAVIVPRPRTMKLLRSLTSTLSDAIMKRRNGKCSRAAVARPPSPV